MLLQDEFGRIGIILPDIFIGPYFALVVVCDKNHFCARLKISKLIVQPLKADQRLFNYVQRIEQTELLNFTQIELNVLFLLNLKLKL